MQPALTTTRFIPADFYTSSHYIFGQTKVGNQGVLGILTDPHNSYMEVSEASIARLHATDQVINYSPVTWVVKRQMVAVCLTKREHIGPVGLARGGYERIFPVAVMITSPDYEVRGTLEWAGRFDFSVMMGEGISPFLPIYDAVMISTLYPKFRVETPAMLFNRSFLDTLVVMKSRAEG